MNTLQRLLSLVLAGCLLSACSSTDEGVLSTVSLQNPADEAILKVMEIPYSQVAAGLEGITDFKVIETTSGTEVPFQLEYRGQEEPLNLLVQVRLPAKGEVELELREGKHVPVTSRAFARYVPERMDDFAWENDKVAFRMYGKALEGTPGDAHGIDVWVKRTPELIIDKWYKSGDYHADHGDGLDYYSVGMTLGGGDIAPYVNDSIWFPKHYRAHQVLDNGPLRATFRLDYDPWNVDGRPVKVSKLISLDAGSQLNRVEVLFETDDPAKLPVAVGIVQRAEPGKQLMDRDAGIIAYWEPAHGEDGITGVGAIIDAPVNDIKLDEDHLLAITEADPGVPLVYYTGAAWNKAGEITSAGDWFVYLKKYQAFVIKK